MRERTPVAPGIAVVILRARSDERRPLLAVDEDLLIALAPPVAAFLPERKRCSHKHAPALELRVVVVPRGAVIAGAGIDVRVEMPGRAEMHGPRRIPSIRTDLCGRVAQHDGSASEVVDGDCTFVFEGHRPAAFENPGARSGRKPSRARLVDGSASEEVAGRNPHRALAVKRHLEHRGAESVFIPSRDGHRKAAYRPAFCAAYRPRRRTVNRYRTGKRNRLVAHRRP